MNTPTSVDGCVYLVDDDQAIRESVGYLLKSVNIDCRVFASPREFLDHDRPEPEACLVVDIRMPVMSGLELQRALHQRRIRNPLIFMTGHGDVELAVRAMRDGAFDFLQKPVKDQALLDSVNAALRLAHSTSRTEQRSRQAQDDYAGLSPRERQVMRRVAAGKANKVIAHELNVSQRTVEIHRARVMTKMGAASLAELVRLNILLEHAGVIEPDRSSHSTGQNRRR